MFQGKPKHSKSHAFVAGVKPALEYYKGEEVGQGEDMRGRSGEADFLNSYLKTQS